MAKLTQEQAADSLGLARTTLLSIEAGKRAAKLEELRAFASLYGVREGELLAGSRQPLDLDVKFRASGQGDGTQQEAAKEQASKLLNRLAASTIELEELLGYSAVRLDYPGWQLTDQSIEEQAEDAALMFRQRVGVGVGPFPDLKTLLELEFGIRVFERPLHSSISGACSFDKSYGGFILLNSVHWPERRQQTAGHEAGHGMVRPGQPVVVLNTDQFVDREDKFCDAFGRALLMPAAAVRRKAAELKGVGKLTVRHILWLAAYFGVSMEAMARRLEALGLITRGTYDSLKNRGLSRKHLEQVMRESDLQRSPEGFTPRLLFLAGEAYERGLLTEQQIAERLELDLASVRHALESALISDESETGDART
jgi:Zn-dependent peptidase ImmA (M78 family)/transcriptional regulator with XRE-family HTH domain